MVEDGKSGTVKEVDLCVVVYEYELVLVDYETGRVVPTQTIQFHSAQSDDDDAFITVVLRLPADAMVQLFGRDWRPGVPLIEPVEREKEVL